MIRRWFARLLGWEPPAHRFIDSRHPSVWEPEQQVILEDRGDDFH